MILKTLLVLLAMILSAQAFSQKKAISLEWKSIQWKYSGNGKGDTVGVAGPVTGIHNGVIIVGGGANFPNGMPWENGKKQYYSTLTVFKLNELELAPYTFQLPFSTAYGASCSTPLGIVYAGGENENGLSNKVLLIQWDNASKKLNVKQLANIPEAVTNASIAYHENVVYLIGGETIHGTSSSFLCLDLNDTVARWKKLPPLPISVSHAVAVACGEEKIFLIGGRTKNGTGISTIYATVFQYSIDKKRWIKKTSMPYSLCAGTGIAANANHVLLFGGDTGGTFTKVETLLVAIQNETDPIKKQELVAKKNLIQSNHPGFSREILQYNTALDSWMSIGEIPFEAPVTTTAFKNGNEVIIPSGEIKAGVRAPGMLTAKLSLK